MLSTWVNRIVIGFVIGLITYNKNENKTKKVILHGALIGLIISGSFYLATEFKDTPGFIAGIIYGIIINYIATKYGK